MEQEVFYKERYEDIQRAVYGFMNEVELATDQQNYLMKRFSLGTEFEIITNVQSLNDDLLITGYIKTKYRELEYTDNHIKGKFVESGNYLKEIKIQVPAQLFDKEIDAEDVKEKTYTFCTGLYEKTILEDIKNLEQEKQVIEQKIEQKRKVLQQFT